MITTSGIARRVLVALALALAAAPTLATATPAHAADPFTVTTLHFKVVVGPNDDTTCDIVGDLYVPNDASPANRMPAILTTNGFAGSKNDQAAIGTYGASHGYVVLSYSGLGFGGSSCKITLDDPDWDGKAGKQLVSFLGGASGIAFTDAAHTMPAPVLDSVKRDTTDHEGNPSTNDPRVGTVGGSYGGGFQFATASVDPRVDTLIPIITWNDLSYSLGPNNTDRITADRVSTTTPGATKLSWGLLFSVAGLISDVQNQQPPSVEACPNFADFVCPALLTAGSTGFFQPGDVEKLRHASVADYIAKIKVPVLLIQGQRDNLFNLNEAVATYKALQAQGTEVKMMWQQWGHSDGEPAPGEGGADAIDPSAYYLSLRAFNWFDHYLKDSDADTGPEFAWYRPWISYSGIATPAYGTSDAYPVGTNQVWRLSGAGDLTTSSTVASGSQSFVTPAAGAPTTLNESDVFSTFAKVPVDNAPELPGTAGSWTSKALDVPMDVVGSPVAKLTVDAPTAAGTQPAGPAGQLVLFLKVQDVAPDGSFRTVEAQDAPVRIPDVTKPFTVTLPGIVHRFAPGHKVRLVVSGASPNFRGGLTAHPVTIASGAAQTITFPVTSSVKCLSKTATIVGSAEADTLTGTSGDDVIYAGTGNDTINGGGGNDTVCGGAGNDTLVGGAGNDGLYAEDGNDNLLGEDGNDYLSGGTGSDRLAGGAGYDLANYYFDHPAGITATIGNGKRDDGNSTDGEVGARDIIEATIEGILGTVAADILGGTSAGNTLDGRGGADRVVGYGGPDRLLGDSGNDTLIGGDGADSIVGGSGADTLYGQAANDTLYAQDGVRDVRIDGGTGTDRATRDAGDPAPISVP